MKSYFTHIFECNVSTNLLNSWINSGLPLHGQVTYYCQAPSVFNGNKFFLSYVKNSSN